MNQRTMFVSIALVAFVALAAIAFYYLRSPKSPDRVNDSIEEEVMAPASAGPLSARG